MKRHFACFAAVLVAATGFLGVPMASAAFSGTTKASSTFSSPTIAAPTRVTFTCTGQTSAEISWTATTSTYATGYTLLDEVNGGSQQVVQTGVTGTSLSISVTHKSTYTVALESTYHSWTSATSTWTTSTSC